MIHALWTAATGMEAMKFKIDVIANNLSNVNTDGFKRTEVDFSDLLYQYIKKPGLQDPTGWGVGLGTKIAGTTILHQQGSIQHTESNLDWAIDGIGFFQVTDFVTSETLYTRKGSFKLSPEGKLISANGMALNPEINIPADAVSYHIGDNGEVFVQQAGSGLLSSQGKVSLARFQNPSGLEAIGNSLYRSTTASGDAVIGEAKQSGFGSIIGRALEASNVEIVREMVDLISTQKAFDTNSKVITVSDKMMDTANNLSR